MIRLTIHAQSGPQIHLFKKDSISLGKEGSGADLTISEDGLQPLFLNITNQNGFPIIINLTNDPFISLNGHPFGKKLLNHGDIILIRDTEILFEISEVPEDPLFALPPNSLPILNIELPFEHEVEAFKDHEWPHSSIDDLSAYIEGPSEKTNPIPQIKKNNKSTKIFSRSTKWILFLTSSIIVASILGGKAYQNIYKESIEHEMIAARGVADTAMALTNAKLYDLKPGNQNWNDSDFFKSNLKAVLSDQSSYADSIDSHGNFTCCPYTLRTYTNQDFSRFLLIAQPSPNLAQWILPKFTIIVDSETMELRSLSDIRTLNRLLANYKPLDESNGKDISRLFKESPLIPLHVLSQKDQNKDFLTPSCLAERQPGCEHFIYNAPRYYSLSQSLIQKTKNLLKESKSNRDLTALKHEIEILSRLPFYTIYAPNGKSEALVINESLSLYTPSDRFFIGYLRMAPNGTIQNSDILDISLLDSTKNNDFEEISDSSDLHDSKKMNLYHPIHLHLSAIAYSRNHSLSEASQNIEILLKQHSKVVNKDFKSELEIAIQTYLSLDSQFEEQIRKVLLGLSNQYKDLSESEFILFAKESGLESILVSHLFENRDKLTQKEIENQILEEIEHSTDFSTLKKAFENSILNIPFNLESVESAPLSIAENRVRNRTLDQIEKLLLLDSSSYKNTSNNEEEELNFKGILNNERLIHPHERLYFMNEFEEVKKS
jgi:hypothetical protein